MRNLVRLRNVLIAAGLLASAAACRKDSDTADRSDYAAEQVKENVEDVKEESRDLGDDRGSREASNDAIDNGTADRVDRDVVGDRAGAGHSDSVTGNMMDSDVNDGIASGVDLDKIKAADDLADEQRDVGKNAAELRDANASFEQEKRARIATRRAVHGVAASQPMLINALVGAFSLEQDDRGEVNEKLQIFQTRIDEAANTIAALDGTGAEQWEDRNESATKAVEAVEDAREDAWEALDDADHLDDRTSMIDDRQSPVR